MKEYFDARVRNEMESALNDFGLKIREGRLKKMMELATDRQYEVLRWVFDKADDAQYRPVNLQELANENAHYSAAELAKISDYLNGERLIEQLTDEGLLVQLTHKGIVEIQNSIIYPQKSTEHFPLQVIQNFNTFSAPVGSFQQGNENIARVQQNIGVQVEDILNLITDLREHVSDGNEQEALDYIDGLEAEAKSGKPNESRTSLFLKGLGNVVKETGKDLLVEIGKKMLTGEIQIG